MAWRSADSFSEYWLLNKPRGVVSTVFDPQGRPTVVQRIPSQARLFPVGRLDLDSTGLIVLTNDGELTARLLHPRYHVEKEYIVTVRGVVSPAHVSELRQGIDLEEGRTSPADVEVIQSDGRGAGAQTTLRLVIREGRKRQVRRMMESVGTGSWPCIVAASTDSPTRDSPSGEPAVSPPRRSSGCAVRDR